MKTETMEGHRTVSATGCVRTADRNSDGSVKIQTILVPTDFSPPAAKALAYASVLACHFGAKLVLMHAVEPNYVPDLYPPVIDPRARADAETRLRAMGAELRDAGVLTREPRVVEGVGWDSILAVAESSGADLIVISTHGYTGLKHLLLGSTTERVVRHASCPVLVVREHEHDFVATTASAPAPQPHSE